MVLSAVTLVPASGFAFELSGAWASQQDLCSRVFTKKGNAIVFAELSDLFGSGFVIDGKRIRGRTAKCTISSRKQEGDNIELAASCATSVMSQSVRFNLKVLDDDTIVRNFPDIPDMTLRYSRCRL
ncbi:MAG: hypothetical protein HY852_02525 [Bradyrhizobium sp.]|uniref:hypothetical protein n=1 Tax=Bradyrhizobium sp. TaxID=376 RepID=UPI0025B9A561|nr:hypothetical protein [Bradyrhizobium sp.]MBI5260678.1 hypothetical protein [Bradyrhizobium sp.]